jgi:hypothetical protein
MPLVKGSADPVPPVAAGLRNAVWSGGAKAEGTTPGRRLRASEVDPWVVRATGMHAVDEPRGGHGTGQVFQTARCKGGVGLVARMIAECMPSATWWVGVMVMWVNPAAASPWWYSAMLRAPAMQPT